MEPGSDGMTVSLALIVVAIALATGMLSLLQAIIGSRFGTDNATHLFMIGQVRKHGGLFTRVPDLLNNAACGAFPLYLHAGLSILSPRALAVAPFFINPIANAAHVGVFAVAAATFQRLGNLPDTFTIAATMLFGFCPQFFHAFSARNFGFSSRGIGLLCLTVFFVSYAAVTLEIVPFIPGLLAMIVAAYLVFAFNTFAAQALLIVGTILAVLRAEATHLAAVVGGLALFVALHPKYSMAYIRDTLLFIRAYARELAPVFILARRHSIWRDWIWDIPRRFRAGAVAGFHYLYENSLVVGMVLNPLTIAVIAAQFTANGSDSPPMKLVGEIGIAGLLAMLLTSFRATRFLGEPERYVEATAPWIILAGGAWLWGIAGAGAVWALASVCVVMSLVQLALSEFLARRVTQARDTVESIADAIAARMDDTDVRLVANNEQYTKLLLPNPWKFSYFIAVGKPYCGMSATEAFSLFPILRKEALERIVLDYRITVVVLQKQHFSTIFDCEAAPQLRRIEPILNTPDVSVLRLEWEETLRSHGEADK